MKRIQISVKGIVQGVGFRPFIYNLALDLKLKGSVTNTSDGVIVEVEGDVTDEFIKSVREKCPPLAKIDSVEVKELPFKGYDGFEIIDSIDTGSFTLVSPDISICKDCAREMFDPSDRRYLYPFINCTNCGPRYSITKGVPYDRPNTTMSVFKMCPACMSEYNNPADRRFHAQPNACPECGPVLKLRVESSGFGAAGEKDPLKSTVELLKQGAIVAVKGLGGFHLCCDAENEEAVKRLRAGKRRSNKPFALMSPDVETIRRFCEVSDEEKLLLEDIRRPIVLLKKKAGSAEARKCESLSEGISPNNKYLGFMLPYTPLHYLLFHCPSTHNFDALIMTSANLAEEPIVIGNDEAVSKLSGIADAFLTHNRDIFMRVDDSVVTHHSFVRRSRGYVPDPVMLTEDGPDVLGCGADIKNTFTLTKGGYAIVSQHIGDMENLETLMFFEESLANLKQVYRANPVAIAHDLHPGYLSTRWATSQPLNLSTSQPLAVQHHWAHIASVMAEHGLKEKVIGVAFDGTGYGTDGNLWGGEFLVCDLESFARAGHFKYIPLPGGEKAIRECWRTAISYVFNCGLPVKDLWDLLESTGFVEKYGKSRIENLLKLLGNRQFSPLASGAGRLFDAVSALAGICDENTFEGEAAIALENVMQKAEASDAAYPYEITNAEPFNVDFSKMVLLIIEDLKLKKDKSLISLRFHNTLINAAADAVGVIAGKSGLKTVALSGGVFQNEYLIKGISDRLSSEGFAICTNVKVPCNDAGISLGQAYILREKLRI